MDGRRIRQTILVVLVLLLFAILYLGCCQMTWAQAEAAPVQYWCAVTINGKDIYTSTTDAAPPHVRMLRMANNEGNPEKNSVVMYDRNGDIAYGLLYASILNAVAMYEITTQNGLVIQTTDKFTIQFRKR